MTDLDLRAGQIHRGLGVVARWTDIVLVIPSDADHDAAVDQLFADLGPEPSANQLVAAVNTLLAAGTLKSVGMLVEATGGPLAMAFGPVEVLVDGDVVLNGSQGGVRQQLPAAAKTLTLRTADEARATEAVPPYDLRRGIAPGAGLTLAVAGAARLDPEPPAPPTLPARQGGMAAGPSAPAPSGPSAAPAAAKPEPVQAEAPAGVRSGRFEDTSEGSDSDGAGTAGPLGQPIANGLPQNPLTIPFRSVVLVGATIEGEATPLPLAGQDVVHLAPDDLEAGRVEVPGVLCPRKHFNNPDAAYCMVCGLSMLHLSHNPVTGLRPTLGFIVFDDGTTYGLDRSYVIGREPRPPSESSAQPLILRENNETLSRTHARLNLDGWRVELVDLESTNGTYIWDAGGEQWNQLSSGQTIALSSGDTVALGRRTFFFESVSSS